MADEKKVLSEEPLTLGIDVSVLEEHVLVRVALGNHHELDMRMTPSEALQLASALVDASSKITGGKN